MLSLGDWFLQDDVTNVQVFDENNQPVGNPIDLFIKDLKVADAAQSTAALGVNYNFWEKTSITLDYNFFGNLYADYNPLDRTSPGPQSWKTPDYSTVDASLRHGFQLGNFDATVTARLNNVFNTEYIADALDGTANDAQTALVWYGFGRTFNLGLKIKF
jgi:outer membrane receptor protein involved in Fe transport